MDEKDKREKNEEEYKKAEKDCRDDDSCKEGGRRGMGGYHISSRALWLMTSGALGALAAIGAGKASRKIKPLAVGTVKEGYAFKEWATGKYEAAREEVEDIVAEGVYAYHKDTQATVEAVKREKEILGKVEEAVKKKAGGTGGKKKKGGQE